MVKKRGLGKSLDALLSYTKSDINVLDQTETSNEEKLTTLAVSDLERGKYQPRRDIDPQSLEDLANSIRKQGIIQPLIVRPLTNNPITRYEIIAGERRWRAAQLAGLNEVPAIVRNIPDEAAIAIALIENIQRENLNPIEEALALDRLLKEFEMTHQEIADAIGKSRASVTNLLRLLSLPDAVKTMLESGQLEMGHARALLTMPEPLQLKIASIISLKGLSVREAEQLVRREQQDPSSKNKKTTQHPDLIELQNRLSQQLHLRVAIQCSAKGKGKLLIHYKNLKELDHLLTQLTSTALEEDAIIT